MRLVTFEVQGAGRLGAMVGERVIDLQAAGAALGAEGRGPGASAIPADMLGLLQLGDEGARAVRALLDAVGDGAAGEGRYAYSAAAVRLRAPLSTPPKILCIGQNYRDHVLEQNAPMPEKPIIFSKFTNTVIGPGDGIVYPSTTRELDYEAELVVVIGKTGKHVARERAYDHVAGYMAGQDVTARDLQRGDGQWVRGKSQDTFAPLGPYLVTRDEVPDPQALDIKLWVNGEVRQDSNTRNLIFDVPYLIEFIAQGITLTPGDLIYTGTPPGVGAFRKPPAFLRVGDEVTVEVEKLGRLTNRVVAEG
jgi:acylpyruvate hydrolase